MEGPRTEEATPIGEEVGLRTAEDQVVGVEESTPGPAVEEATAERTDASTSQIALRTHPEGVPMDLEQHALADTTDIDPSTNPDPAATTDSDAEWNGEDYMHDLRRVKVHRFGTQFWTSHTW